MSHRSPLSYARLPPDLFVGLVIGAFALNDLRQPSIWPNHTIDVVHAARCAIAPRTAHINGSDAQERGAYQPVWRHDARGERRTHAAGENQRMPSPWSSISASHG